MCTNKKYIQICVYMSMSPDVEAIIRNIKEDIMKTFYEKTSNSTRNAHWIMYEALLRDAVEDITQSIDSVVHVPFLNVFIKAFETFTFELVNEVVLRIRGQKVCTLEYMGNIHRRCEALLIAFPIYLSV